MAEEKSNANSLLINTKQALARAEKELIAAKRDTKMTDENTMKVITTNYEIAKNNLAIAKQLAGETEPASSKLRRVTDNQSSVAQSDKQASSTRSFAASATASSQVAGTINMTRHQYREKLKQHHQS